MSAKKTCLEDFQAKRCLHFFDFFTVDYFAPRSILVNKADDAREWRNQTSERYGFYMVFMSLILNAELSVLFSSSNETIAVRQSLTLGKVDSLHFWAGLTMLISVIFTILSLASTFTAWSMVSAPKERPKIFSGQMPETFISSSIRALLASLIMFSCILIPPGSSTNLLGCLVFGLVYALPIFQRFSSVVSQSTLGSIGNTKSLWTHWMKLIVDEYQSNQDTKRKLTPEQTLPLQISQKVSPVCASIDLPKEEHRESPDGLETQDFLDNDIVFSDDSVIVPSTKKRSVNKLFCAQSVPEPNKPSTTTTGWKLPFHRETTSAVAEDLDPALHPVWKVKSCISSLVAEAMQAVLDTFAVLGLMPLTMSTVWPNLVAFEHGHDRMAQHASFGGSTVADEGEICEGGVVDNVSQSAELKESLRNGEGCTTPEIPSAMAKNLATKEIIVDHAASIEGSDEENQAEVMSPSIESGFEETSSPDRVCMLPVPDTTTSINYATDSCEIRHCGSNSVSGQDDLSSHYDCEFRTCKNDDSDDEYLYNYAESGIVTPGPGNMSFRDGGWLNMGHVFPLSKQPSTAVAPDNTEDDVYKEESEVVPDIETAALLWLETMKRTSKTP